MGYIAATGGKASLPTMLMIMVFGISFGQYLSYRILSAPPLSDSIRRYALPMYASLIVMFSTFTFLPPKVFLFENFFCYQYTGEYGILTDYEPYRVFVKEGEQGAGGVNYCANVAAVESQAATP
jgi:hypothetical protein